MVWLCFPGMTSSLANHRCTLSYVFYTMFLFLTFLDTHIYFIILKTYDQQFTLTTKKSLHIIFKDQSLIWYVREAQRISQKDPTVISRWCWDSQLPPVFFLHLLSLGITGTVNEPDTLTVTQLLLLLPFNGLFSRTTCISQHQKGKPVWILLEQEMMRWQWHQLDHM